MAESNVDRFLAAFARIEVGLRGISKSTRSDTFAAMLSRATQASATVRRLSDELQEFAELRNAIVHERGHVYPIADPHPSTVERIEQLDRLVNAPARTERLLPMNVMRCSPEDPIGLAARTMFAADFSQLPVYDKQSFVGTLTAETIARWVADQFRPGLDLMEERQVGEVLAYRQKDSTEAFVSRTAPLAEVIELFEAAAHRGERLDAVLVTGSGQRHQQPLGIVTVSDLPRLMKEAGLR